MSRYYYKKDEDNYYIYDSDEVLKSPGGNEVSTLYLPLAERIVNDLEKMGYNYRSASSILSWHFTMTDNFSRMEHSEVETMLYYSFLMKPDWTFTEFNDKEWHLIFGDWYNRKDEIQEWLSNCSHMQMTAACCIGNAYESINLSYVLASFMEKNTGDTLHAKFEYLAELCARDYRNGTAPEIMKDFLTFELYYGIHLKEDGPIIGDSNFLNTENEYTEFDMVDLQGTIINTEVLRGRNFIHYIDGSPVINGNTFKAIEDLELDLPDDEDDEVDNDEFVEDCDGDKQDNELLEYIPDDCWIKRYVDTDDPNTFYIAYLEVAADGTVESTGCLEETSRQLGGGGFYFMLTGAELPSVKSYEELDWIPEKIENDLKRLEDNFYLPKDFSFIGRKMPESVYEGDNYSFTCQSAQRLAYIYTTVYVDENGVIESFDYTTYQSTGTAYDSFTRPMYFKDRKDEAMDVLLKFYDFYTEEELSK